MKHPCQVHTMACIAVLVTSFFLPISYAIKCYRCTIKPPEFIGDPDQPCSKFDSSSVFYQDCPASTFCMKHIIHYQLPNGSAVSTFERNCASQKYVFRDYNYAERKWEAKELIDTEAYKDGCFYEENNKGTPNGPSQYCYCSSNYCNGSSQNYNSLQFQTACLLVTLVLLIAGTL